MSKIVSIDSSSVCGTSLKSFKRCFCNWFFNYSTFPTEHVILISFKVIFSPGMNLLLGANVFFRGLFCFGSSLSLNSTFDNMLYFDLRPGQTCHSKMMHWKEVTHSDGTYEEKSHRWTWLTKWDKEKIPWYTHRLMHRKRVTSELHDSYFHLMTIKHAIPRIEWAIGWALNYDITQSRQEVRRSDRRDVVGKATPGRKGPWSPWWVGIQRSCW